jgi:hypothetical protein
MYHSRLAIPMNQGGQVKPDEIKVGHFYVGRKSSYLVREITHERSANDVYWRSYDVATGEATGDSGVCSKQSMVTDACNNINTGAALWRLSLTLFNLKQFANLAKRTNMTNAEIKSRGDKV